MTTKTIKKSSTLLLMAGLVFTSFQASPEDIDIFSVDEDNVVNAPNVLIVLDNSANWSREAQKWPDGTQGYSEAEAIKQVIANLDEGINVGLMEYITGGASADRDSGYIRYHVRPMNSGNKAALTNQLNIIQSDIEGPPEKRDSNNPYANLFWDVYNYFGGFKASQLGAGTLATKADTGGYVTNYSEFRSPLTSTDTCTRTIVIFIGNNNQGAIPVDSAANKAALHAAAGGGAAGDAAVTEMQFPDFEVTTTPTKEDLGRTAACFGSAAACTATITPSQCSGQGYFNCFCNADDVVACPSTHWSVIGRNATTKTDVIEGPTTTTTETRVSTGDTIQACKTDGQANSLNPVACPNASDVTTINTPVAGQDTRTQTSWTDCLYEIKDAVGCGQSKNNYELRGIKKEIKTITRTYTEEDAPVSMGSTLGCYVSQAQCTANDPDPTWTRACSEFNQGCECVAPGSTTDCPPGTTSKYMRVGEFNITEAKFTESYSAPPPGPLLMDEWARFLFDVGIPIPGIPPDPDGTIARTQVTTYTIDVFNQQQNAPFSGLLFSAAKAGGGKYFQAKDQNAIISALTQIFTEVQSVNSAFSSASLPINATNRTQNQNQVFIGVFKPNRSKDPQWFGNLKRFQIIRDGADIDLGDSQSPPMSAINNQTGFISDCAVSYWTTDSGAYWGTVKTDDPNALGICKTNTTDDLSDLPDGPFVEKGAVAEVLRKGNLGAAGSVNRNVYTRTLGGGTLLPFKANFSDASLTPEETVEVRDFTFGHDMADDDTDGNKTEPRSTIHGDVVHSRPQPVSYSATEVVVFYGSNDGHFRAVQAEDGKELWSFVAPEHFKRLQRLRRSGETITPKIRYFDDEVHFDDDDPPDPLIKPSPLPTFKDYFFDGSTGVFQSFKADNTIDKAWIFPTMRRGGRMIYAFDVSNKTTPSLKWAKGCPNDSRSDTWNDTDCSAGFANIGQTWSNASVGFIRSHSETTPVIITGGGYDKCDDENTKTPCAATKGRGVYIINADTGALVKHFDFSGIAGARGVAADVALISINPDKFVDYAYAVDTAGNVYRMDFVNPDLTDKDDGTGTPGDTSDDWTFSRVAYTTGGSRKFLFTPALLQTSSSKVYLAIGTGDREHPLRGHYAYGTEGSPASAVKNRFYVWMDDLQDIDATTATNLDSTTVMEDKTGPQDCNSAKVVPGGAKTGWFMDLTANGQGEQVVSSAVIAGGFVNFSTNRPTPPSTVACATSLGEARGYFVNLLNGSGGIGVDGSCGGNRSSTFVGGGLPPSPVIATVKIGDKVETIVIGAVPKGGGAGSAISPSLRNPNLDTKRRPVYWYKSTGDT